MFGSINERRVRMAMRQRRGLYAARSNAALAFVMRRLAGLTALERAGLPAPPLSALNTSARPMCDLLRPIPEGVRPTEADIDAIVKTLIENVPAVCIKTPNDEGCASNEECAAEFSRQQSVRGTRERENERARKTMLPRVPPSLVSRSTPRFPERERARESEQASE